MASLPPQGPLWAEARGCPNFCDVGASQAGAEVGVRGASPGRPGQPARAGRAAASKLAARSGMYEVSLAEGNGVTQTISVNPATTARVEIIDSGRRCRSFTQTLPFLISRLLPALGLEA